MPRKNPFYDHDPAVWAALSLSEQLECIRKHLCAGPGGQSSDATEQRSRIDAAMRAARRDLAEQEELGTREHDRAESYKERIFELEQAARDLAEAVELLRPFAMIQPRFRVEDHDHWYGYQTTKEAVERAAAFLKRKDAS